MIDDHSHCGFFWLEWSKSFFVSVGVGWKKNKRRCIVNEKNDAVRCVSLWLIESNWPKVFFALSSKTDHFVYLVARLLSFVTHAIDSISRADFLFFFLSLLFFLFIYFCFVFYIFRLAVEILFWALSWLFRQSHTKRAKDKTKWKGKKKKMERGKGKDKKNPVSWSMIQCQRAGEETDVINNRRRSSRRRARQAKTTNQFLLMV